MSIKKIMLLLGLCFLFVSCSTGRYSIGNLAAFNETQNTSADIGMRYLLGRGVPQNDEKAFTYFSRGAKEDDPLAQNELAYLYAVGKGTEKDENQAFFWYKKAAEHGLSSAEYNVGFFYLHGIGTHANKELAMKWLKKAADKGFEPARLAIAQ